MMNIVVSLLLLAATVNCQQLPITPNPILPAKLTVGSCKNFVVEAQTDIAFNGGRTTITSGDIGVSPGTSITGDRLLVTGKEHYNDDQAKLCTADMQTAYKAAKSKTCTETFPVPDLAGKTLSPGVYCSKSGTFSISAGTLTLDGTSDPLGEWVFQTTSTLVTASATEVKLTNGAKAENVYWAIGSSATLGSTTKMVGNILAQVSITFNAGTNLAGRGLAQAAVTFESASKLSDQDPPIMIGLPLVPTVSPVPAPVSTATMT